MAAQTHAAEEHPLRPAYDGDIIVPHKYDPAAEHPLAYAPQDEPDWVADMLKHGLPYGEVRQHVLFRWKGAPAWLAVTITDRIKSKVTLIRITGPGTGYQELFLSATNLAIIEPSGSDFFHDGAAILALKHDQGFFPDPVGIILLHLADRVTTVTAPGHQLVDISPDGAFVVASYGPEDDDGDCYPCLVNTLVGLRWGPHGFTEACKDLPQLYDAPALETSLRIRMQDNDAVDAFRANIELALLKLQKGNFAEAARLYRDAQKQQRKQFRRPHKISASIEKAILSPSRQKACPVSPKGLSYSDWQEEVMTFTPPLFHPESPE
jgi:hypothetical protein